MLAWTARMPPVDATLTASGQPLQLPPYRRTTASALDSHHEPPVFVFDGNHVSADDEALKLQCCFVRCHAVTLRGIDGNYGLVSSLMYRVIWGSPSLYSLPSKP